MKILSSASKLVFLMMALTACSAFMLGILESKDFMLLCTAAFSFYFGANKPGPDPTVKPSDPPAV